MREGIEVVLLSRTGQFLRPPDPANRTATGALRVAQLQRSQEPDFALETARQFVDRQTAQLCASSCSATRGRAASTSNRWEPGARLTHAVDGIGAMLRRVDSCRTINSLSGVEGQGAAVYFRVWKELLKTALALRETPGAAPPPEPVNVLAQLRLHIADAETSGEPCLTAGLDPYVGFLHQLHYNRPSLPLDLVEEFRPVIVDSVVLRCLNNGNPHARTFRARRREGAAAGVDR